MASGLKISIKWKIFALVAVMISCAIFFIVLRTNRIFRADKEAFVKELSAKLSSSTSNNILSRITALQDKLVIFISSRESLAHTGAKVSDQVQVLFSRYQEFYSIGFLTTEPNGSLKVDWILRNPTGNSIQWPKNYESGFLTKLSTKTALANGRGFWKAQSPDGSWLSVLGFSVRVLEPKSRNPKGVQASKIAWVVGILPSSAFDDLLTDFSTGLNTGFVVDNEGVAIAHSNAAERWKIMRDQPIVAEVMRNIKPAGAGDFLDSTGRVVIGSFESVPKMNLTAIVTTPRDKAFEAADELARNIFIIGGLILFISLAIAILFSNYLTAPLQKLSIIASKVGAGDFKVPIDVSTNDEIGDLARSFQKMEDGLADRDEALANAQGALVQSEKMSAFGQLSAGIAHEVKNPLAGILGHAQLAMGKIQNPDIKKHLEVIEKETRRCKAIVENLMKFARAEKAELKATDLAQVCQDTINLVDHQLSLAGCKIFKDFRACPMVLANANQLQQVLLNLMVNASHAMENSPTKNVIVHVLQVGTKAQIQIEDTGQGIPPEIHKKIFEPFFTTKPAGQGTGLGLSVSIGIVKDHKGEIYLKSEANKGTIFYIDIPIPENAKISEQPLENTHGGQIAAANAAVAAPAKPQAPQTPQAPQAPASAPAAHQNSDSPALAQAPATSVQANTALNSTEKNKENKPVEKSKIPALPQFGNQTSTTNKATTEKPAEIKATSQKTGLEYKIEGTPEAPKVAPFRVKAQDILNEAEKNSLAEKTQPTIKTAATENFDKASALKNKEVKGAEKNTQLMSSNKSVLDKEKTKIGLSASAVLEKPKALDDSTVSLGGKAPLDEKTIVGFALPQDISGPSAPQPKVEAPKSEPFKVVAKRPQIIRNQEKIASTEVVKDKIDEKAVDDSDFKVKIKRPRLKGNGA